MQNNKSELSQKTLVYVYTHNLAKLTPGKIWVTPHNEFICSIGLQQRVSFILDI